jgi:hypothetical protein
LPAGSGWSQAATQLHRAEQELARGGGDLWDKNDRAEDIAHVMVAKLSNSKAEQVARAILAKIKGQKRRRPFSNGARHDRGRNGGGAFVCSENVNGN